MIFSKLLSTLWPHYDAVGKKCARLYEDYRKGDDIKKYTTNGTEDRKASDQARTKRFDSPTKNSPDTTLATTKAPVQQPVQQQPAQQQQ